MKLPLKYFGITFSAWLIGVIAGVSFATDNTRNSSTHSDACINTKEYRIEQDISDALLMQNDFKAFTLVASNNLKVASLNIAGGIMFGIVSIFSLLFNGFAIATTCTEIYQAGFPVNFLIKYTLPHSFELIAIWWSVTIGTFRYIIFSQVIIYKNKKRVHHFLEGQI